MPVILNLVLAVRLRKPITLACASALLLCSLVTSPSLSAAEEQAQSPTLRERLQQRWLRRDTSTSAPDAPGNHTLVIEHNGQQRAFLIHVPQHYRKETAAPLLLAFHGGGGDMNHMATDRYYGLISLSEKHGVVVAFPNGYSNLRSGKLATWNAGRCCAAARDEGSDDVGFVRQLVETVSNQLHIDRTQIFATGMSNGGMLSYRLACEMADTFTAIAAVAGTDNTLTCSPATPVSILHIHARNDDRVLFNGGAGKKFRNPASVTEFTSVPATISKWQKLHGCPASPQRVLEVAGAYCERYAHCQGDTAVQLCVTETGEHSWPGGSKPRSDEPPSQALSANEVMWAFFRDVAATRAQTLPGKALAAETPPAVKPVQ